MAHIPEEVIRSVQDAIDIVDVVSRYATLKRSGSSFKGLCPFHEEKTPSFVVFPQSGRYKCFGCGEAGDGITFLMKRGRLSFREAVEELAREAGIAIPVERESDEERERAGRRRSAVSALEFAAGFYRAVLRRPAGRLALEYLLGRGFTDATIDAQGLGFAPMEPGALRQYAARKGVSDEVLIDAGLVRRNEQGMPFDFFRGRVMFPIRDLRGQVIGFGARAMGDAQPKYLNSPDSPLFRKGREMYGLDLARPDALRAGRIVVVEGYTDVLHCRQAGLGEVAAGLGTALTPDNAAQLRRFSVPVVLLYDGDEAGRRAAERAAALLLEEEIHGAVALLPPGLDPADVVVQQGVEGIESAIAGAQDLWDYRVARVIERHDLGTLDGRERAVDELLETVGRLPTPLRRDSALKLLSWRLQVPESTLRDRLPRRRLSAPAAEAPAKPVLPSGWRAAEEDLVSACLVEEGFLARLEEEYPPEAFRDPDLRAAAEALRDLRGGGQSLSRESLLAAVADRDSVVRALLAIELEPDGVQSLARAEQHLRRLGEPRRIERAVRGGASGLEARVRARGGRIAGELGTERNDDRELRP